MDRHTGLDGDLDMDGQMMDWASLIRNHPAGGERERRVARTNRAAWNVAARRQAGGALDEPHEELKRRAEEQAAELVRTKVLLRGEIAERNRIEKELQQSEERFRLLVNSSHAGVLIVDDAFRFIYVNDELCHILGYSREEIIGQDFRKFLDDESKRLVADHYIRRQRGESVPPRYEFDALRKDGGKRRLEISSAVTRDAEGNVRTVAQVLDVTERRRAEAEREWLLARVQEQAERLQQVVAAVPEGVLLLDTEARLLLVNPAAREHLSALTDVEIGDVLVRLGERSLAELLAPLPRGLWHEIEANGPPHRVFELIARPMANGHGTEGWVLVLRDVSEEREIQRRIQQQEQLAALGQMATGMAHDFNNIMATIILYAQMLSEAPDLSSRCYRQLDMINRQAGHAVNLIQQILDFCRHAPVERQPLDLLLFLKEQVKLLEDTMPEGIEVHLTYGAGPYAISADRTRIHQVVMNLALNARDAMPEGGTLHIGLARIELQPGGPSPVPGVERDSRLQEWVRLTVSDTGTGIPPEALGRIFEPFFSTKPTGEGTGLGLAQVWGIVRQHGGHVDVTTKVGEGTTFTLYLPALSVER